MDIFSLAGFAIVSCVVILLIEQYLPQYKALALLGCGCILLLAVANQLFEVVDVLKSLADQAGNLTESFRILIQCLGIAIVTQIAADTCSDCGQRALAGKVELAGKILIVIVLLPTIQLILQKISQVLGMV